MKFEVWLWLWSFLLNAQHKNMCQNCVLIIKIFLLFQNVSFYGTFHTNSVLCPNVPQPLSHCTLGQGPMGHFFSCSFPNISQKLFHVYFIWPIGNVCYRALYLTSTNGTDSVKCKWAIPKINFGVPMYPSLPYNYKVIYDSYLLISPKHPGQ